MAKLMLQRLLLFFLSQHTKSIIIRDDVPDSKYLADADKDWPFVFPIDSSGGLIVGDCAATLIKERYAITAAHCFGKNIKKFPVKIKGQTYQVISVYRNPCFSISKDGPDGADAAVMKLDKSPPSSIPRVPIYPFRNEVGKRIEIVGWGDTGKAGDNKKKTKWDKKFRAAENIVTKTQKSMVVYTFDKKLPLEGLAWSGDSGGPAFITVAGVRYIAGVNSAGDCCNYGSQDGYSRLSTKYKWIEETISKDSPASFNCKTLEDSGPAQQPTSKPFTKAPIKAPTKSPISPLPSGKPSTRAPIKAPTKPPINISPITSTSTESPTSVCKDESNQVFYVNKKFKYKSCDWLRNMKNQSKINKICNKNKDANYYCRETCNSCDDWIGKTHNPGVKLNGSIPSGNQCINADGSFWVDNKYQYKDCNWLQYTAPKKKRKKICTYDVPGDYVCQKLCDTCKYWNKSKA